uniref:PAP-associated domain-containing protein n=1 Tax=Haptolina ericina TaxID=156174 RepID=A0A7S3AW46_9EUKA
MMLVVKSLLELQQLRRSFSGGLSSFGLLVLLLRFLRDFPPKESREGTECLGSALLGFLDLFGRQFEPAAHGVTILGVGGGGFVERSHPSLFVFRTDSVFIQDPINPTNNLGYNCYRLHEIQRLMAEALVVIERQGSAPPQSKASSHGWHLLHHIIGPILQGL